MKNQYRHYNLPWKHPYLAFFGDNWRVRRNHQVSAHFHNCMEIGYCRTGEGFLLIEEQKVPFSAGDFVVISENVAHRSVSVGESSLWEYVYLDPYLILRGIMPSEAAADLIAGLRAHFCIVSRPTRPDLYGILQEIFRELHERKIDYPEALKGLFLSLLWVLKEEMKKVSSLSSDFQWLYRAIDHMRNHYREQTSIAWIAQNCCDMSESHFRKKFRETMGIAPLEYRNHLRIRIACQEICRNQKPIHEIARESGFPCLSSFHRNFQALLGCSPLEWMRTQQEDPVIEIRNLEEKSVQSVFRL